MGYNKSIGNDLFSLFKDSSIISKKYFYNYLNINKSKTKSNEKLLIDLVKKHSNETNYDFSKLYIFDQYFQCKEENYILGEMEEAKIKFSPTYKYNIGSIIYDVSKRTPSWCDRIFYKKFSKTIPLAYNKCLLTISDHQPIYGVYKIRTEIIDKEKKKNILNQIIKEKQANTKKRIKELNDDSIKNNENNLNNINDNEIKPNYSNNIGNNGNNQNEKNNNIINSNNNSDKINNENADINKNESNE